MPKAVQKPVGYATAARDRQNPLSHSGRVPGIAGAAMTTSSPATGQIRPEQSEKFNYLLFVTLVGTENPPIQRLLSIPSHFTFRKVHKVLQIAFGWNESHLHRFDVKEVRPSFCSYRPYMSITSEEPFDDYSEEINEKKITLRQVYEDPRHRGKVAITYQYDCKYRVVGRIGSGSSHDCLLCTGCPSSRLCQIQCLFSGMHLLTDEVVDNWSHDIIFLGALLPI